ncbi:hypothetical protein SAMN05216364_1005100 [Porphyromonadaceae bacterium KHP3R9]|nr:hypothetical protein SAMN05216364_1005100 [Porphyromonadaceae bacterium KHP3R9]
MIGLSEKQKKEIRDLLEQYCGRFSSRNSASESLKNVSASTIHSVLNGKWQNISDAMWKSIRSQVSDSTTSKEWQIVETPTFREVNFVLSQAQEEKTMIWLTAKAGSGKTTAAEYYRSTHKDVIYLLCDEDMRKSSFAIELARAAGIRINTQKLAREKIMIVIDAILEMDNPLIIFDEGDKLSDNLLCYFITIYNHLKGKAGIVFLSTNYMQKRMEKGILNGWKGYDELESRIGRKFYEAEEPTANDVYAICMANGVTDEKAIAGIVKDASQCNFDLRRVDRKVKAVRKKVQLAGK